MGQRFPPAIARPPTKEPERCELGIDPLEDRELLIKSLRAALDGAQAAKKAKTAFLATISHELRTPVNAILGFAELISKEQFGPIHDRRYPDYANDIVKGAERLLGVLNDLIDMAELESGRTHVRREHANLAELVEESLAVCRERHPLRERDVQVSIALQFPELWTDPTRLRQILVNLISNALSFTKPDGLIVVSGHFSPNGDLEIVVADSGSGMSAREISQALTRFGHGEDEMSRRHQGIGLGLPLAKSLTELLGGRLKIESAKGEGTVVTLSFPTEAVSERAFQWQPAPDRTAERALGLLPE